MALPRFLKPKITTPDAASSGVPPSSVAAAFAMLAGVAGLTIIGIVSMFRDSRSGFDGFGEGRSLSEIAAEIRRDWKKPYFGAVPYLQAMSSMTSPREDYGLDSGESIVLYFLANANAWRGDTARRVKAELKALLK